MISNPKSEIDNQKFRLVSTWAIPLFIFLLALLVRAPSLDVFFTADEHLWIERSRQFTAGLLFADYECAPSDTQHTRLFVTNGKGCTFQTGHPGVTTMWGGSLGLLIYYQRVVRPTGLNLLTFLQTLVVDQMYGPALIGHMRLPLAIAAALFLSLFYVLLRRLFSKRIALVSTLLVTLSPFHIALSRVLHHDALTATFMALSSLAMIGYWLRNWRWYWLIISAVFAGLSFLSKSVGFFMMPYAAVLGLLALYYRQQDEHRSGWSELWQLVREGTLWVLVAWLTFVAFFPAMWIIPKETIQSLININFQFALDVHEKSQYFLGKITSDPGLLFYPLGWLMRASPLEIVGLLILPVAAWRALWSRSIATLPHQILRRPLLVALALFLGLFLLLETVTSKKMIRYFLPAFPVIDVFVAIGLLWLVDNLDILNRSRTIQRWTMPTLIGLILVIQGWFVFSHYPYYFTYYNPLFGGNVAAARLITIHGWGEGLNEAAAYLNQLPEAESLQVATWYNSTFKPFFVGDTNKFSWKVGNIMNSDYLIYYHSQLQSDLQNMDVWHYLQRRSTPIHRITLHGLDYVLIYQNPIQHHVDWKENGLPDMLNILGYNLPSGGNLSLFWQNLGLDNPQQLWAGLTPAAGGEIQWLACLPTPSLAAEVDTPGSIIESLCPLVSIDAPADLYDLHLGLGEGENILPIKFPAGRLALSIDTTGQFAIADPSTSLARLLKQERPDAAIPLDIAFGSLIRLVGYQFEPTNWKPGQTSNLVLYWQPLQEPDLGLAGAFELVLRLSARATKEPVLTSIQPMLPDLPAAQTLKRAEVIPMQYPISVPASLPSGEFWLDICLTMAANGQAVVGTVSSASESIECVSLPLTIRRP
jgi:hypothetical protein